MVDVPRCSFRARVIFISLISAFFQKKKSFRIYLVIFVVLITNDRVNLGA